MTTELEKITQLSKAKELVRRLESEIGADAGQTWDIYYNQYVKYIKQYNTYHVHKGHDEGLADWYANSRKLYRNYLLHFGDDRYQGGEDFLTHDQYVQLTVAYNFDNFSWLSGFLQFKEYYNTFHHSLVPSDEKYIEHHYEEYILEDFPNKLEKFKLGLWVHRQRDRYFKGIMSSREFYLLKMYDFLINTKLEFNLYSISDRESLLNMSGHDPMWGGGDASDTQYKIARVYLPEYDLFIDRLSKFPHLTAVYNWLRFHYNAKVSQELVSEIDTINSQIKAAEQMSATPEIQSSAEDYIAEKKMELDEKRQQHKVLKESMRISSAQLRIDPRKKILNFINDKYFIKIEKEWHKNYKARI